MPLGKRKPGGNRLNTEPVPTEQETLAAPEADNSGEASELPGSPVVAPDADPDGGTP